MHIGKREQIVISVIVTLLGIGAMHFFLFAPAVQRFKESKQNYDQQVSEIQGLKTIKNPKELTSFTLQTAKFISELTSGTRFLQLEQPEEFVPVDPEKITVKPPAGASPDAIATLKKDAVGKEINRRYVGQYNLLMKQIARLQAQVTSKQPAMTFLSGPGGWRIPTALPQQMQTGQLWDVISVIEDTKNALANLSTDSSAHVNMQRQYNYYLGQLGFDVNFADSLKKYGEFVPLYYKLAFVALIKKQVPADRPVIIHNAEINDLRLVSMLDIKLPFDQIKGLTESKLYFAYEFLNQLNNFLDMAKSYQVGEITNVTMFGYGFLRQQDSFKMANAELPVPAIKLLPDDQQWSGETAAQATPAADASADMIPGGAMGGGGAPGAPGGMQSRVRRLGAVTAGEAQADEEVKKEDSDIGYALPIRITFHAENMRAWNFMYEVLRRNPLVELNRLTLNSVSVNDSATVEAAATFIFVPKLFDTIDAVRKVLEEIQSAQQQPGPTAAAQ